MAQPGAFVPKIEPTWPGQLVVIDCLGIDDKAETGKAKGDLFAQASGQFRGELFSSFIREAAFIPA